eukprot:347891_1
MATAAAQYVIQNQDRIINILNSRMSSNGLNNGYGLNNRYINCRKRVYALNSTSDPIDLTNIDNGDNYHSFNMGSTKSGHGSGEAKRSNRAWSGWDERELIKLKSLGSLTWNRVGECLQRTGAACQLHWKTMKNMNTIQGHIEYIKKHCNNNDKNYKITKETFYGINSIHNNKNMEYQGSSTSH